MGGFCGIGWAGADFRQSLSQSQAQSQSRITAHSTALICQDTELRGDISFGEGTIVHPKAIIIAAGGPIVFGKNCVIEETSAIINRYARASFFTLRLAAKNRLTKGREVP